MKNMKWTITILGAILCAAPFLFGYTGNSEALWDSLILGALITFFGYFEQYRGATVLGGLTFYAPFVRGFGTIDAALWSCVILGTLIAILAGYQGFFSEESQSGLVEQSESSLLQPRSYQGAQE